MAVPSPGIARMRYLRGKVSDAKNAVEDEAARLVQKTTRKPLLTLGFAFGVGIAIGGFIAYRRLLTSKVVQGAASFQNAGDRVEGWLEGDDE